MRNRWAGKVFDTRDEVIAEALLDVSIPTLMMSLVHITGNPVTSTWPRGRKSARTFWSRGAALRAEAPRSHRAPARRRLRSGRHARAIDRSARQPGPCLARSRCIGPCNRAPGLQSGTLRPQIDPGVPAFGPPQHLPGAAAAAWQGRRAPVESASAARSRRGATSDYEDQERAGVVTSWPSSLCLTAVAGSVRE
jgi:hypothetical protein